MRGVLSAVFLLSACGDDAAQLPDAAGDAVAMPDASCDVARTPHPDAAFEQLLKDLEVAPGPKPSGLGVAVFDGTTVKSAAIGKRYAGGCEPFTTKTRVRLGRPTRTLVSIAVLIAVHEGKLALDNPVSTYVPGFDVAAGNRDLVTIRNLLDHTAGVFIPGFIRQCPSQDLVGYWSTVRPALEFTPGAAVGNFDEELSLLGAVLASAYNMPYREVIKAKIFTPLGMTATYDHDEYLTGDHALGGLQLDDPAPCAAYEPVHQVYASLDDMIALMQFLNGTNGNALAITPSTVRYGDGNHLIAEFKTGSGLEHMPYDAQGNHMFFSDGDIANFGGEIDLFGDLFSVALVTNGGPCTYCIGDKVIADLSTHDYKNWLTPLPKSRWTEYEGTWIDSTTQPPRTLEISFDGTSLTGTYNSIPTTMKPYGEDTFEISLFNVNDRVRFWRDSAGTQLMTSQLGKLGPAFRRGP
jgi:CubicO group peptidase (beta-lactamase class C family)